MAITYNDNGGSVDGSNKAFTFTFPYLKTEDVKVALNGKTQATTKYAVSTSPTKITFNNTSIDATVQESDGAPKTGVNVRIYRKTDCGAPKAVFAPGSTLRASDINNNQEQALFSAQEMQTQSSMQKMEIELDDDVEIKLGNSDDFTIKYDSANGDGLITSANTVFSAAVNVKGNTDLDGTVNVDGVLTVDNITGDSIVTSGTSTSDTKVYSAKRCDELYYNIGTAEEIQSGETWAGADNKIATTAAIDARIIDLVDDVGGFVPITNELSFPNTNPDVNNGAGTIVSIKATANSITTDGSGSVGVQNGTLGGSVVTINGFPASTTYDAGTGMLVETTSTLNTYNFHRTSPEGTDVTAVAGKVTEIGRLGTADAVADMAVLGTADVVSDLNTLGTADVVNDMNVLATSSNVTNMNTLAGISSNITTVANNNANVTKVANIDSNVNSVVSNSTNINTVAGIDANVTTVAGIAANVTTVASDGTDIGLVAGSIGNVNTTADNISNVNTVAGISANVTTVANDGTDIGTVAGSIANVNTTAGSISNVNNTGGSIANVNTTAGSIANVNTTASNITNVNNVGNSIANVNTVAGISSDVTAVAGDATDIGTCSTNIGNIAAIGSDLANNYSNITDYGSITGAVSSTSGTSDITTVADSITNVNTVAGKNTQIGLLGTADAIADMNTLGTAAIVEDLNLLGTTDCVADMAMLATTDVVADMALLATTDCIADMALLGTADAISDMNKLATTEIVADLNILGTTAVVADMDTLADISTNITTVANNDSNVTTCASNITTINNASTHATNALAYRDAASGIMTQNESLEYNLSDSVSSHTAWGDITDSGNSDFANETGNTLLTMSTGSASYNYGAIT